MSTNITPPKTCLTRHLLLVIAILSLTFAGAAGCDKETEAQTESPDKNEMPERASLAPMKNTDVTPEPITIAKKTIAVGSKRFKKKQDRMKVNMAMDQGGEKKALTMEEETLEHIDAEVLAVNDHGASKLKVTYVKQTKTRDMGGRKQDKPIETAGQSYIVDATGGALKVTTPDGGAVPPEQEKEVKKDFKRLGKPNLISDLLPESELKPGQKIDATPELFLEMAGGDDDEMSITDTSMTYIGTTTWADKRAAVFDVKVSMSGASPEGMAIDARMTGRAYIDPDTRWSMGFSLHGDLDMSGDIPGGVKLKASGQMGVRTETSYTNP